MEAIPSTEARPGPKDRLTRVARAAGVLALCLFPAAAGMCWIAGLRQHDRPFVVVLDSSGAPCRTAAEFPVKLSPGERVLRIDIDRYEFGAPCSIFSTVAYLVTWHDPAHAADPLPAPDVLGPVLYRELLGGSVRLEPSLHRITLGDRLGLPMSGQRLLQGFDLVGTAANVFAWSAGGAFMVWAACAGWLAGGQFVRELPELIARMKKSPARRRRDLILRRVCPDCAYQVDATDQERCPECGLDLQEALRAGE